MKREKLCLIGVCGSMVTFFVGGILIMTGYTDSRIDKMQKQLTDEIMAVASDTDVRISNLNMSVRQLEVDMAMLEKNQSARIQEIRDNIDTERQYMQSEINKIKMDIIAIDDPLCYHEDQGEDWVVKAASVSIDENGNEFYMIDSEVDDMAILPDPNPVPQGNDHLTKAGGVYYFEGHKETYYNLPMGTVVSVAKSRGISGDYWVRSDGCKMLGNYIMVAAGYSVHPYGSTVNTSLGMGIVVDTGGFASWDPTAIDISTTW